MTRTELLTLRIGDYIRRKGHPCADHKPMKVSGIMQLAASKWRITVERGESYPHTRVDRVMSES